MNQQMPQIKNQALRFVTFLVGTLSIIFLLIIVVISSKFYSFREKVNSKQVFISSLHKLEEISFQRISNTKESLPSPNLQKQFKLTMQKLRSHQVHPDLEYLLNEVDNNWLQVEQNEITGRQFINNARNLKSRMEKIVEEDFISFSFQYSNIQRYIILYSVLVFLFSAVLLLIISQRWLAKVANPIVMVAKELLKTNNLTSPLNLPPANYLEQEQLNRTLMAVWNELRNLDYDKVRQIKTKNLKLRSILMSIDDVVFFIDANGKLSQANETFLNEFHLAEDDIGKDWNKLVLSPDVQAELGGFMNRPSDVVGELYFKDSKKTFHARKRSIVDEEDGTFYGTIYMLEDISEGIEQQRVQKEFVAVLSHELKTPIQSLTTASELLCDFQQEIPSEEYKIVTNTLFDDVRKVKAIAEDFVRFSKSEINTMMMNEIKVDLYKEILSVLQPLRILISDKKISITVTHGPGEEFLVNLDTVKFSWALSNIVLNAYRASPEGAEIRIHLAEFGSEVEVKIIDQGTGLDDEAQKSLFRPFKGKRQGSFGLGLAIAKQVIDAHNGKIEFMKNDPIGTVFIIRLPLLERSHAGFENTLS